MPITPLPAAPSRQSPATFADKADALLGALAQFVTEANLLEAGVNAKELSADAAAAAAAAAQASANFKGLWVNLTGAATVPYCVFHLGKYWQLASNIADITLKVPGTATEWLELGTGYGTYEIHEISEFPDDHTAAGLALLDDADAAAQRSTLGLAIGTDVMAYEAYPIHEVEDLCSVD